MRKFEMHPKKRGLRLVYVGKGETFDYEPSDSYIDFAVTPQALAHLCLSGAVDVVKPLDFILPGDVKAIKNSVVRAVLAIDLEWRKHAPVLPFLITSIGTELCILLETLMEADLVLNNAWKTNRFSHIHVQTGANLKTNMLQYEYQGYQFVDVLTDPELQRGSDIKVVRDEKIKPLKYYNENVFYPPLWKKTILSLLGIRRAIKKLKLGVASFFLIKMGLQKPPVPSIFVVPNKDNAQILKHEGSVILNDYLSLLPVNAKEVAELQSKTIDCFRELCNSNPTVAEQFGRFKNIIYTRVEKFFKVRTDLFEAYVKIRNIQTPQTLKIILPSSIGCATDAWSTMAIQEKNGISASGQHGGGHNSFIPYSIFAESRFSFNFTYGGTSPSYDFFRKEGNAELVVAGSPAFYSLLQQTTLSPPPQSVKKIFYVMNLCVPFYSANFPWEFIIQQFDVLALLNSYGDKYVIDVKAEHSNTVDTKRYPKLNFINVSPKEAFKDYDLLVLESAQSTAVLEATVTNKFMAAFTGAEWEDLDPTSLEMLEKRAECFHTTHDFFAGLEQILSNPDKFLDATKLHSSIFRDTYANPVLPDKYIQVIQETLQLHQ